MQNPGMNYNPKQNTNPSPYGQQGGYPQPYQNYQQQPPHNYAHPHHAPQTGYQAPNYNAYGHHNSNPSMGRGYPGNAPGTGRGYNTQPNAPGTGRGYNTQPNAPGTGRGYNPQPNAPGYGRGSYGYNAPPPNYNQGYAFNAPPGNRPGYPPQGGYGGGYNPGFQGGFHNQNRGRSFDRSSSPPKRSGGSKYTFSDGPSQFDQNAPLDKSKFQVGQGEPSECVWVGNMNPLTSESELRDAFGQFGELSSVRVVGSKNCAFVRYFDTESAIRAYNEMAGAFVHGNPLKVGWGKPSDKPLKNHPHLRGQPVSNKPRGKENPPCKNLHITNVDFNIASEQLFFSEFSPFGPIESIKIYPQKNCVFVNFQSMNSALACISTLQGKVFLGRPLIINFGKDDRPDKRQFMPEHVPVPHAQNGPSLDPQTRKSIDDVALNVFNHGREFEQSLRSENMTNPKYAFMFPGGIFNDYYQWKLYELSQTRTPEAPDEKKPEEKKNTDTGLTEEELGQIKMMLGDLETNDLRARSWILQHPDNMKAISYVIYEAVQELDGFSNKIGVLHLIHEILLEGKATRKNVFAEKLFPLTGVIFRDVTDSATEEGEKEEIESILTSISSQGVYNQEDFGSICNIAKKLVEYSPPEFDYHLKEEKEEEKKNDETEDTEGKETENIEEKETENVGEKETIETQQESTPTEGTDMEIEENEAGAKVENPELSPENPVENLQEKDLEVQQNKEESDTISADSKIDPDTTVEHISEKKRPRSEDDEDEEIQARKKQKSE
eukprot:TRINITY_DN865_c0_g1_i4.p1 TRINITY_DN865_c0_g1~~TRINITY_DN865_c0_g1_i4.p1  ORF type:complete len:775 (-),score=203.30 TRINITY_DN865_c0_g1_i4:100-2424(-)